MKKKNAEDSHNHAAVALASLKIDTFHCIHNFDACPMDAYRRHYSSLISVTRKILDTAKTTSDATGDGLHLTHAFACNNIRKPKILNGSLHAKYLIVPTRHTKNAKHIVKIAYKNHNDGSNALVARMKIKNHENKYSKTKKIEINRLAVSILRNNLILESKTIMYKLNYQQIAYISKSIFNK